MQMRIDVVRRHDDSVVGAMATPLAAPTARLVGSVTSAMVVRSTQEL